MADIEQNNNTLVYVRHHNWVTFLLARLYCCRHDRQYSRLLYAYLRTVDDYIDTMKHTRKEKQRFLAEQRTLIDDLYAGSVSMSKPMIAQIVEYDRNHETMLRPFIARMMDVFEFDSERQYKKVSEQELLDYSLALGSAYTELLIRFVEPRYRVKQENVQLAHACHLSHMLRDFQEDLKLGYINISEQDMAAYRVDPNLQNDNFKQWLRYRIALIRKKFRQGTARLNGIPILSIKIIARLYCFRYEAILNQIEDADYRLLATYHLRLSDILKLLSIIISTIVQHIWYSLALWRITV